MGDPCSLCDLCSRTGVGQRSIILLLLFICFSFTTQADDGYRLWMRYDKIENDQVRKAYIKQLRYINLAPASYDAVQTANTELQRGLKGLLDVEVPFRNEWDKKGGVLSRIVRDNALEFLQDQYEFELSSEDGYVILTKDKSLVIFSQSDKGILYATYHLLRLIQTQQPIDNLHIVENPKVKLRLLNHWDNLDGTVERGYAGFSIWNWHQLPEVIDQRYIDYARANASIGINGAVVTNVNANALIFRPDYMEKAAALANVFRKYGIKLYLTARFNAPMELGGLKTADPLDADVQRWWQDKFDEMYERIPDFGGVVVKANSEGQPGPREYGRTHADGANMLADALVPHGGVVMWRAFVYSNEEPEDRAKQAFNEFMPLDGSFRPNVLVQVKNGPIDFQPREPVHPLFGAMTQTPLMMEFQITKEYLGQATHLVSLGEMYEEVLQTDTYFKGKGSIVARVVDGSLHNQNLSGIAGVANIGTARNWTGNLFGQADWYAFGRLAWDPDLSSTTINREWAQLTFSPKENTAEAIVNLMTGSHQTNVNYMTPLGLHHIMGPGHHYGPGPWVANMSRADWTSVYYHKADSLGIGFDRTSSGSDALSQYHHDFASQYENVDDCPEEFLLWYHHVPWDHRLKSGKTLWQSLCESYDQGASEVGLMRTQWMALEGEIDPQRFAQVLMHLNVQVKEAKWWRDACLSYFQKFSDMAIPAELEQPAHDIEYYENLTFPYAPGIRPRW